MENLTKSYSSAALCDSVPTVIQQLCRTKSSNESQDEWIGIPGSHTPGGIVIRAINITAWPAAIRERIRWLLLEQGGVPLEFPKTPATGQLSAKLLVPPAMKQEPKEKLPALSAEPVTDTDDPPSSQT